MEKSVVWREAVKRDSSSEVRWSEDGFLGTSFRASWAKCAACLGKEAVANRSTMWL